MRARSVRRRLHEATAPDGIVVNRVRSRTSKEKNGDVANNYVCNNNSESSLELHVEADYTSEGLWTSEIFFNVVTTE
jgi:hypothetical protein